MTLTPDAAAHHDISCQALARVIDASDCHEFVYSRLDDAVAVFDRLVQERHRAVPTP